MPPLTSITSGDIANIALQGFLRYAPILLDADFYISDGLAANFAQKGAQPAPASIFRPLNNANAKQAAVRTPVALPKKFISFDSYADVALEDANVDVAGALAENTEDDAVEHGYGIQEKFFYGDTGSDVNEFDGFATLVNGSATDIDLAAYGFANGLQVPLGNSDANFTLQQQFIETFIKVARMAQATHAYIPNDLYVRYVSVAKHLGYYSQIQTPDGLVDAIAGIIIRMAGLKKNGTSIIPFDENLGASNDCASIFFINWGRSACYVETSAGVTGRYGGVNGSSQHYNHIDLHAVIVQKDLNSILKVKGFRL